MKTHPHRDLVVVGGGILGLMVANVAYKRGFRDITIYEEPGPLNLNSDTLRNHAWLQSGLLYGKSNLETARTLSEWGRRMLEEFGYLPPETKGIFRFADDGGESEKEFNERANRLRLVSAISRLTDTEARSVLGAFFRPYFIHYWVPDAPFDEAFLLYKARQRASIRNIYLRQARISLIKRPDTAAGFAIVVDGKDVIESRYTVLCAGSGLPALLDALGLAHPLAVFRSALLRIAKGNVMRTPLLVDISEGLSASGLSVLQHDSVAVPPKGCFVVGSKDRVRLKPAEVGDRRVTRQEDERLRQLVPQLLLPVRRSAEIRAVAGHKVEACDGQGNPSVAGWKGTWSQLPRTVAAVPGKATQALFVAEEIIDIFMPTETGLSPAVRPAALTPPPGKNSDYVPRMHHDQIFDGVLDEVEK